MDYDDLSIGFDTDRNGRQLQLTNNKNQKGEYHVRIILRDIFGFAEHHEKVTFVLGDKLTSTGNTDNSVLNNDIATKISENNLNIIQWYVPHCIPSVPQQAIMSNQILTKTPTELQYVERSGF